MQKRTFFVKDNQLQSATALAMRHAMSPSVPGLQSDSHVICDQAAFSLIIEAKNFDPTFAVLHSLKESLERSGTRLVPAIAQKDGVQVGRPEPFSVWLRNGTEQTNDLDQK